MGSITIRELSDSDIARLLPYPSPDANKYTRGVLFAIGGSSRYPGAICMASKAAYLAGAGYVEAIASESTLPILRLFNVEAVTCAFDDWQIAGSRLAKGESGHPCACLIGSGLSPDDPQAASLFSSVLEHSSHPIVLDGGGITLLATDEGMSLAEKCVEREVPMIVTPHMGEAARLARAAQVGMPQEESATPGELAAYAARLAGAYGATVVLKGPDTYIAAPRSNDVIAMRSGTAALAKAGTGDVLAGIISGLAAQGIECMDAAVLGATLHARAGVEASLSMTEISTGAPDVIACIPAAIRHFAACI